MVQLLLADTRVDVNKTNGDGHTPLFAASLNNQPSVAQSLLQHEGVDVNRSNPLLVAAQGRYSMDI